VNFKLTSKQRRRAALKAQPNVSDEGSADKIYNVALNDFANYAEFFEKNHLDELFIEEKGTRILFRSKQYAQIGGAAVPHTFAMPVSAARADESAARESAQDETADTSGPAPSAENVTKILSPLNGTFYASSTPDTPPFVSVGVSVSPGTVLCLIEAMKIYNELKAESTGRIIKVLVKNAESVKEGQELFWIE
jgi:acetyl-CoA carboxylase biotin carboxyl carrier protein